MCGEISGYAVCNPFYSLVSSLVLLLHVHLLVNKSNPEKLEDECDFDQSSKDLCEATGDGRELRDDESIEATPPLVPSMDDLLSECFCMAIKSSIKKEDLPVLTSTFYRSHMMPLW